MYFGQQLLTNSYFFMELKDNFLKVVKDNYANFDGRARRKEYWQFVLAYFVYWVSLS